MSCVDIRSISFSYAPGQPPVINNYSLSLERGEIVGILGPSGSGKSTLLRLIAGLESPFAGSITISGRTVVDNHSFTPPEKRGVGMIFQDYGLFPHLTVSKNITFGLHRHTPAQRQRRLSEMLSLVQMVGFEHRYPHELSGGQQQRVALARALAPQPTILLLDEPFSSIDANLKASIRNELKNILEQARITCLLVTHDHEDVAAICHHSVLMYSQ